MWHRLQVAWIVTSECFSSIWTKKSLRIYSVRGGSMITTPWSKKKSDSYVEITNEAISYFDERKEYKLAQR